MTRAERRGWLRIAALPLVLLLLVPIGTQLWGVQYDYTLVTVAMGGAALGIVSGALGCFAVLRGQSLLGDALSHAALPGVAIAFLLAGRETGPLLLGAGLSSWLGVMAINSIARSTRIKLDAAMGIVLSAFFALGITLLTFIQARNDASQAGLDQFIFGQAATIKRQDVLLIGMTGLLAFGLLAAFWKEFKLVTFDPAFARALGFRLRLLDVLLSTLIVMAIVLGLQLAGVILMVGMLIAPAVAARQWTHGLGQMLVLAGMLGGLAGAVGAILSGLEEGLPTGPLIIVVASGLVLLSLTFAPGRGLLAQRWQQSRDRRRFTTQRLLRDIQRHAQGHGTPDYPAPEGMLVALHGTSARATLRSLAHEGLLVQHGADGWALSAVGQEAVTAYFSGSDISPPPEERTPEAGRIESEMRA